MPTGEPNDGRSARAADDHIPLCDEDLRRLRTLARLREQGILNDEEFEAQQGEILSNARRSAERPGA